MAECEALRQTDAAPPQRWVCRFGQYRRWHGVLIPTVGEASYVVAGEPQPYARFVVRELEYEPLHPF